MILRKNSKISSHRLENTFCVSDLLKFKDLHNVYARRKIKKGSACVELHRPQPGTCKYGAFSQRKWPWSSYRSTVGAVKGLGCLNTEWILAAFAKRKSVAIEKYKQFVAQAMIEIQPSLARIRVVGIL